MNILTDILNPDFLIGGKSNPLGTTKVFQYKYLRKNACIHHTIYCTRLSVDLRHDFPKLLKMKKYQDANKIARSCFSYEVIDSCNTALSRQFISLN